MLDHFPKKSREVLGQKIEQIILEILELISKASYSREKINNLANASLKLDFLKILIRIAYETKTIDQKKYLLMEQELQEIGKMLGGWIRSIKNINPE
jgi:four helix bundle protein